MPPVYQIPPWLHPPDTVGPFVQAQRLRAEMEMQQQRLAQQTQMAAMEAQIKREQSERESMLSQQRIEVAKAQQQQEAALKMQELEQAKQRITQQSEAAARKYQAMAEYQQRIQSGADPLKTILELGPAMGQQSSAEAAAIRAQAMAQRGSAPVFGTDPETGVRYAQTPSGGLHILKPDKPDQLSMRDILNAKLRMRTDTSRQIPRDPDMLAAMSPEERKAIKDAKADVDRLTKEINDLISKGARSDSLVPVERGGKKGFIHKDDLDAARGETDDQGNAVYKLPADVPAPSDEEVQGEEDY